MTDNEEHDKTVAVSEQPEVEPQGESAEAEQKMIPLAAVQSERKKRQEAEERAIRAEAKSEMYQEYMNREKASTEETEKEDPTQLVERQVLEKTTAMTKREIKEELFQEMNPKAVQEINTYLKPILDKKPWLASSVDSAPNRYARAFEIVQDYKHLVEEKVPTVASKPAINDAKKIVANSQKPRSPAEIGKSAQPGSVDYLKSIQGKKEFREYRASLRQG